jgi:hypothetical protein
MYRIKDNEFQSGIEIEFSSLSVFRVYQGSLVATYDSDKKTIVSGNIRKNSDIAVIAYLIKKLQKQQLS